MSFKLENIESQKGKIAVVTGANSGVGQEITVALAKKEMRVIMACRNIEKAEQAKTEILKRVPGADLEIMELDLNSLNSVRRFAQLYRAKYEHLNLLIENAGIMIPPFVKTEDGFESQMGVNHFSHFLLANLLFPLLNKTSGARILTTSSIAHENGQIDFDNLNSENGYSKMKAYGQSKLACLMFAYELQDRLEAAGNGVIAASAHPGVSKTNLFQNIPKFAQLLMVPFLPLFSHSPEKAALPMIYAALGDDVKGGDYFGPIGFRGMKGEPGKVKPKLHSYDKAVAKKLWEVSENLTGEDFKV